MLSVSNHSKVFTFLILGAVNPFSKILRDSSSVSLKVSAWVHKAVSNHTAFHDVLCVRPSINSPPFNVRELFARRQSQLLSLVWQKGSPVSQVP